MSDYLFLKVYSKISEFRGESAFSTWLYRITITEVLQFFRKRKHRIRIKSIDDAKDSVNEQENKKAENLIKGPRLNFLRGTAEGEFEAKRFQQIQKAFFDNLDENDTKIFKLKVEEALKPSEIAQEIYWEEWQTLDNIGRKKKAKYIPNRFTQLKEKATSFFNF